MKNGTYSRRNSNSAEYITPSRDRPCVPRILARRRDSDNLTSVATRHLNAKSRTINTPQLINDKQTSKYFTSLWKESARLRPWLHFLGIPPSQFASRGPILPDKQIIRIVTTIGLIGVSTKRLKLFCFFRKIFESIGGKEGKVR